MRTKPLTFLLLLTFLFFHTSFSMVFADDFQDAMDAANRGDFNEAVKEYRLHEQLAEIAPSQALMVMCFQ